MAEILIERGKRMSVNIKEREVIEQKTATHPCYNQCAHQYARMHIAIAPGCNASCNYCNRKYDCVNESRPGVTSEVLTPEEALEKFKLVKSRVANLTVVGIAGPGDALAHFEEVKRSIELIKDYAPETTFCLSTNGLMLPFYAEKIVELGISHVTITINAVDPKIGAQIYKKIHYLGTDIIGEEAAEILLRNQLGGLRYLAAKGVVCKVNIVMIKNINDKHIPEVVKQVKEYGAFITNIMKMIPVEGSAFERLESVTQLELNEIRKICEIDLKQMYHCKQCRADAIGTLNEDISAEFRNHLQEKRSCKYSGESQIKESALEAHSKKYRFAIFTKTGINIDQHFGHAEAFYIYDYEDGKIEFAEKRELDKFCTGTEDCGTHEEKILHTVEKVKDCQAVLTLRAGALPTSFLQNKGIRVYEMYEEINEGIKKAIKLLEFAKGGLKAVRNL
ncbi:MAG: nitrogenase cofactor biosynthesis protein NifB [Clostridia bacterium]|nr:nitrogenase cofactor biosynthesis protein NifB [Clostridia bacterium]